LKKSEVRRTSVSSYSNKMHITNTGFFFLWFCLGNYIKGGLDGLGM